MIVKLAKLGDHIDKEVEIFGQIRALRAQKKFTFLEVGYGDEQIQVVVDARQTVALGLTVHSTVMIEGLVKLLPEGKVSRVPYELQCKKLTLVSKAKEDFEQRCAPCDPSDVRLDKQHFGDASEIKLTERHLFLRDRFFATTTLLRAQLLKAVRAYFDDTGYAEIIPPAFTGVECEGGATLFPVPYPGHSTSQPMTAFLTQSSQFYLEYAVPAVGDVFCIADSFRAEKSHTRRHLTEFVHVESEKGGIMTFDQHLEMLHHMLGGILERFLVIAKTLLMRIGKYERVQQLYEQTKDIVILEHKDAIAQCKACGIYKDDETQTHFDERDDIPEAQERRLIDYMGKIVFLVKFPKEFKSFYMALDPDDESRVLGCDVEVPGVGEIIGSGVREADYQRLHQRLIEMKLKPEDYKEYLDLRRYGYCYTSGMGLGLDRMFSWLLGAQSIREVVTYPRFPGSLRP